MKQDGNRFDFVLMFNSLHRSQSEQFNLPFHELILCNVGVVRNKLYRHTIPQLPKNYYCVLLCITVYYAPDPASRLVTVRWVNCFILGCFLFHFQGSLTQAVPTEQRSLTRS